MSIPSDEDFEMSVRAEIDRLFQTFEGGDLVYHSTQGCMGMVIIPSESGKHLLQVLWDNGKIRNELNFLLNKVIDGKND